MFPALSHDSINFMSAPNCQQIRNASSINPDDILFKKIFSNVLYVWFVEQDYMRTSHGTTRECGIELQYRISLISGRGADIAESWIIGPEGKLKGVREDWTGTPWLARSIESHRGCQDCR
jgi:hypothetical protein